jgi:hypothetical protein
MLAIHAVAAGACWRNPKPTRLGDDMTLLPTVQVQQQDNQSPVLMVDLPRGAYVNAFLVTPGEETIILYPPDSATAPLLAAGSHQLPTYFGPRSAVGDTGRILRRPTGRTGGAGADPLGRGGRMDEEEGVGPRRWLLVYTSEEPVPLPALRSRVMGFTVPGYTNEALNTVARTVRSISPSGRWAAIGVEFNR